MKKTFSFVVTAVLAAILSINVFAATSSLQGAVFPNLFCPFGCGNVGIIDNIYYNPFTYECVYELHCDTCGYSWTVTDEASHFDGVDTGTQK